MSPRLSEKFLSNLIGNILRWVVRHLISFIAILAILIGGKWFYAELQSARAAQVHLNALEAKLPALGESIRIAAKQVEQQIQKIAKGGFNTGISRKLEDKIAEKIAEQKRIEALSLLPSIADFQQITVLEMEISALKKVAAKARQLEGDIRDARKQIDGDRDEHSRLRSSFYKLQQEREQIERDHPVAVKVPNTQIYYKFARLTKLRDDLKTEADSLKQKIESQESNAASKVTGFNVSAMVFGTGSSNADAALKSAGEFIDSEIAKRSSNFFWTLAKDLEDSIDAQVLTALSIVLSTIFVPIGIKLIFFYGVAPFASRRPPIQVSKQGVLASPVNMAHGSEISIPIEIKPTEELLIHSDYIQSSQVDTVKTTKWVLDSRYPLTSIAAELYMLTRIAPDAPEMVVVSSGKNPEMKVSLINLPQGSAFVMQPRSLVGVLQERSRPLKITSSCRFNSLHSWLTFQFRYIVLHGPATLVVKGCRGVRLEAAGHGRLINQAATIGFSANALYSVRRCETFVSYLRGADELFNDQFAGAHCVYLYEEMPSLHRKGGVGGRGLEGLTDSVLKVFGI